MERTLIILKPDAIQRGIAGEIIARIEKKGLKIVAMKMELISQEKAKYHYDEHKEKPFFQELISFITRSPVILMVVEGIDAIKTARKMSGATQIADALPGTIRGDYGMHTSVNLIHTSDGPVGAEREINNFFRKEEIVEYKLDSQKWLYPSSVLDK